MAELLRIGANVATPLGLAGLVAVLLLWAYRSRLKHEHQQLAQLPEAERAKAVDQMLTRYGVSGADLTKEQRYNLICKEIERKENYARRTLYAAVAVFLVTVVIVVSAYLIRAGAGENQGKAEGYRTQKLKVTAAGLPVEREFKVSYRAEGDIPRESTGRNGEATLTVPAKATRLDSLAVTVPCYKQTTVAPMEITEKTDSVVQMEAVRSRIPDPLLPSEFPVADNVIPDLKSLKARGAAGAKPSVNPAGVVLRLHNQTDKFCWLMLHSFAPERDGFPWRAIPSDPCANVQVYNSFTESSGLFALVAKSEDGKLAYLGSHDLYAKSPTEVVLKTKDGVLVGEVR